jgi:hypothetical protein
MTVSVRAIGIASYWPIVYVMGFVGAMWLDAERYLGDRGMAALLILHAITVLVAMGAIAFDLIYLARGETFSRNAKVVWTVALLLAGIVALPLFFARHIKKTREVAL